VCSFLAEMATRGNHGRGYRPSTLDVMAAAISSRYPDAVAGTDYRKLTKGLHRVMAADKKKAPPLKLELLCDAIAEMDLQTRIGPRDRALLSLDFACGLRRAELSALDVGNLRWETEGLVVTAKRHKTAMKVGARVTCLPYRRGASDPTRFAKEWIDAVGISSGPLFRSFTKGGNVRRGSRLTPQAIGLIVKRCPRGLVEDSNAFPAHSLRAGLATVMADKTHAIRTVMDGTWHQTPMVAIDYTRHATGFENRC
jgi:integrase